MFSKIRKFDDLGFCGHSYIVSRHLLVGSRN